VRRTSGREKTFFEEKAFSPLPEHLPLSKNLKAGGVAEHCLDCADQLLNIDFLSIKVYNFMLFLPTVCLLIGKHMVRCTQKGVIQNAGIN